MPSDNSLDARFFNFKIRLISAVCEEPQSVASNGCKTWNQLTVEVSATTTEHNFP